MIGKPGIEDRPEKPYMGIRAQVPMKERVKVIEKLHQELSTWLKQHQVEPAGPPFVRYLVIDRRQKWILKSEFPSKSCDAPSGMNAITRSIFGNCCFKNNRCRSFR